MAQIVELISTYERVGDGTDKEPYRLREQLWTKDGRLVAEIDRHEDRRMFL